MQIHDRVRDVRSQFCSRRKITVVHFAVVDWLRAERLKKLRHEPHPEFFASADDEDGEKQNDEIALKSKKIG